MADRLAQVSAQIENVRQLQSVVTAMRGIAASRVQRARALLAGGDAYSAVVSLAIGQALTLLPADYRAEHGSRRAAVVLFCAEQGFAGAYSERVLDRGSADLPGATMFLVGSRGGMAARERGLTAAWTAPMATHPEAVPALACTIAEALYEYVADGAPSRIEVVVPASGPAGDIRIERRSVLPLDLSSFRRPIAQVPPLTTLPPHELLERLTAEYVYAKLCEATMHAYAAENQARMMAMTSARNNIEARLTELGQRKLQLRQDEITSEIVELTAGAHAMRATR